MRQLPRILIAVLAFALVSACGGEPATPDVNAKASSLTPGTFCASNGNDPGGCMNAGALTFSAESWTCPGNPSRQWAMLAMNQQTSGGSWFDGVTTAVCPGGSNQCPQSTNVHVLQGTTIPGGISWLPMTFGQGILYLSQSVAMRMTTYNQFGAKTGDVPVTVLGGNLQYYPADSTHPHGSWHAWVSAPNDPTHGICGNLALSWSPIS